MVAQSLKLLIKFFFFLIILFGCWAKTFAFESNNEIMEIEVALVLNGKVVGEAGIQVRGSDEFVSIRKEDIVSFSRKYFTEEKNQEIIKAKDSAGYISRELFCSSIKRCFFNLETLNLEINLDLKDFKPKDISLRAINFNKEVQRRLVPPAEVSGFLTHRTSYQTSYGQGDPRLVSQINSALTIHKGTIESAYFYQEDAEKSFQRINTFFTHDMEKKNTRIQAGDLSFRTNSFMNSTQIGGVRYSREFSLNPSRINQPLNEYEFLVNRKSDVNIYINDKLFQTTVLSPGKYNIKDLPLNLGVNNVRIELIDESGYTETLFFPYIVDQELLEVGRSGFSYELGVKSQSIDQEIVYNHDKSGLIGSFFHRRGVTKMWTPGAFAQVSDDQQVAGIDSILGTKYGLLQLEGATSNTIDLNPGYTFRLTYVMRNFNLGTASNREIRFRYQYLDPDFVRFGSTNPENIYQNQINFSYRERLVPQLSLTLSTNYLVSNRSGYQDRESYSVNLYIIPSADISHNLTLTRASDRDGLWESSVLYFVNFNFGDRKHTATGYHNSRIDNTRVALRGRYQRKDALINTDIDTNRTETASNYNGRLRYRHNRFQAELLHRASESETRADLSNQTNFTLANSFSFAGNKFAISDPIGSSFMLIDTDEQLKGTRLDINSGGAYTPPKVDAFGPAVVTNLTPYQISRIAVDTTELPEGLSVRQHTYFAKMRYKAGTLVDIKSKGSAALFGRLIRPDGTAFGLEVFEFVNINDPNDRIEAFSNDLGEFVLEGLSIGKYRLESETNLEYMLEITKDQKGLIEAGSLRLKVKE